MAATAHAAAVKASSTDVLIGTPSVANVGGLYHAATADFSQVVAATRGAAGRRRYGTISPVKCIAALSGLALLCAGCRAETPVQARTVLRLTGSPIIES